MSQGTPPPPPQGPPSGTPPQPPYGMPGQPPMRPEDEKLWAIGAHLGPLLLGFLAPLLVWLLFKDRSAFLDRHGKEALNFQISVMIYGVISAILVIVIIGIFMLIALGLFAIVVMVLATVKAAAYEDYRYPLTIRLVS